MKRGVVKTGPAESQTIPPHRRALLNRSLHGQPSGVGMRVSLGDAPDLTYMERLSLESDERLQMRNDIARHFI